MEALIEFITHLGWIAVAAVIYAESGLLIGFFLPGDSLLFAAGFLTQQGILPLNIHVFVFVLFIAAVLGDNTGYAFGHRVGRRLFHRKESRFFHPENLVRAEKFYERYGAKTIILARFIPFVRTFAPIVAGISKMKYSQFLVYNLVGSALWVTSFTYIGFYAGSAVKAMGINIEVAAIIIIALSLLPAVIHILKEPEGRAAIKHHAGKLVRPRRQK
jgi:membrane-associated protein